MSTKQETSGNNSTAFQFDPGSMAAYSKNLGQFLPFAQSLYQNPFGNQMFQQESVAGQDQAANIGGRMKSNILANANAMGYGTNGGLINSMLLNASRSTGNLQSQAFRGAVGNANQRAMQGLGVSSAFQPLMTGSQGTFNQTQTTGGLGTWLPQLIGSAAGAAMNAFAPGAGSVTDMTASTKQPSVLGGGSMPGPFMGSFGGGGVGPTGMFPGISPMGPSSAFNYGGYGPRM